MAGHGAFRLLRGARDARFAEGLNRCRGKRWPTSLVLGGQTVSSDPSVFYWARLETDFGTVTDAARMLQRQRADDIALGIDREAAEHKLLALRGNGDFAEELLQRSEDVDVPTGCRNALDDGLANTAISTKNVGVEMDFASSAVAAANSAVAQLRAMLVTDPD